MQLFAPVVQWLTAFVKLDDSSYNGAIAVSYQVTSHSAIATSNQAMKPGLKRRHKSGSGSRHSRRQSRETNKTPEILEHAIHDDVNTSEIDENNSVQDEHGSAPDYECVNLSKLPFENPLLDIEFGDGILDILKVIPGLNSDVHSSHNQPPTSHTQQNQSDLSLLPPPSEPKQLRDTGDLPIEELTSSEYAKFLDEVRAILGI